MLFRSNIANFYAAGTALVTNSTGATTGPWTLGINAYSGEKSNCENEACCDDSTRWSKTEGKCIPNGDQISN